MRRNMQDSQYEKTARGFFNTGPVERQLLDTFGLIDAIMHASFTSRSGQPHALLRLLANGGTMTQKDLQSGEVPISSAALSETLSKLEASGLVKRERSEKDRRQINVSLTESGREEAKRWVKRKTAFEREAFSVLSDQEKKVLLALLTRVRLHWMDLAQTQKREKV